VSDTTHHHEPNAEVESTGVTGYIAGDAFHNLYQEHPDYDYRVLVRTKEKADAVKKVYPSAEIVLGDLDSSSLLEEEAAKADIVLRMDCPKLAIIQLTNRFWCQTPQTHPTMSAPPKPSPPDWPRAIPRTTRDTGFTLVARAS
jgi:hypothetical protein